MVASRYIFSKYTLPGELIQLFLTFLSKKVSTWRISKITPSGVQKKSIKQQIPLQKSLLINQIKNYKNIPVLTNEIEINRDANYSNIKFIVKFENSFSLAGGTY